MCGECEKSLPNQIVFDKIESIIRLMQDEQNGLPVKTAKSFMSKIPSVFTGTDLIQWMMKNLKLEDQQEAMHLANLIASHGYIFPIEDHNLSIKNDCTFYRFQTPCLWPSNNSEPENTDYAVYLCKRTMQGKTRLELADYEAENLARLQKMFSRKWEFIFMQAESQAKVDKKRDKLERKVLDSQERAFWDVYRPVPGCVNTTELDIKKACRLSKSAKRCSECQKVAAAPSGAPNTSSATASSSSVQQALSAPSPEITFKQTSEPEPEPESEPEHENKPDAESELEPELEQEPEQELEIEPECEHDNETPELDQEEAVGKSVDQASSLEQLGSSSSRIISSSRTVQSMDDTVKANAAQVDDRRQDQLVIVPGSPDKILTERTPEIARQAGLDQDDLKQYKSSERSASEEVDEENSRQSRRAKEKLDERVGTKISDKQTRNRSLTKSTSRSTEERHVKACPSAEQPAASGSVEATKKQSGHHHHHHPHPHPHHHHHHHHHHHPHQHGHHHHHQHRQCPHHKHHQHQQQDKQQQQSSKENVAQTATTTAIPTTTTQLSIPTESILTTTLAASVGLAAAVESFEHHQYHHHHATNPLAGQLQSPQVNQLVSATAAAATAPVVSSDSTTSVCDYSSPALANSETIKGKEHDKSVLKSSKKRSVGSVEQFIRAPSLQSSIGTGSGSRRKSECNRMLSMIESSSLPIEERIESGGRDLKVSRDMTATSSSTGTVRPASACCSLSSDGDKAIGSKQVGNNQRSAINQSSSSTSSHHHHHHHHHNQQQQQQHQQQQQTVRKSSLNIQEDKSKFTGSSSVSNTNPTSVGTAATALDTARTASKSSSNANMATVSSFVTPSPGSSSSIGSSQFSTNRKGSANIQHQPLKGTQSVSVSGIPSTASQSNLEALAGSRQNIDDLEKELEALKVRLDRRIGGVKMSKVTQSYLSYFKQWAEYDPFIAQPIPSNPWISDSTELWDSERQTKDVHCRRVRRWAFSLKELLNDPAGREQFHRFLEKEFSAENLKFWDAVQELKRVHSRDVARRVEAIWTEYLAQDANCPINIDSKSYETSKKNMAKNKNNRYIFDEAAGHVYQLMKNDSYPRYLRSEMYKDYKEASEKKRNQVAFDVFKPQITTLKHKFNF